MLVAGHINNVEYLVNNGADISLGGKGGNTPLMTAAEFGHVDIIKYLTEVARESLDG